MDQQRHSNYETYTESHHLMYFKAAAATGKLFYFRGVLCFCKEIVGAQTAKIFPANPRDIIPGTEELGRGVYYLLVCENHCDIPDNAATDMFIPGPLRHHLIVHNGEVYADRMSSSVTVAFSLWQRILNLFSPQILIHHEVFTKEVMPARAATCEVRIIFYWDRIRTWLYQRRRGGVSISGSGAEVSSTGDR